MANTKIRGLTLEIGGDTSGLQKSLKNVNSDIKTTEKQLKDVEKLLKLDPKNTELLAQKQKLLAQNVDDTSKKLKTLKDTQSEFIKQGGDVNSAGYQALQREIISTESALREAKKASDGFSVNMEKASATLGEISTKSQKLAQATKGLSVAGAGIVTALGGMALGSVKAGDELNTLAKQTGLTTEEIQKFQYASDIVDVSVSDITGALKKMKSNMAGQTDTWSKLGISTKDASGEMRDANEVFYETLEALSRIENETERDQVAMSLFGKNADALAGIIDDGGKALKEMGDRAEELGLIMDQETLNSMNDVSDTLDELKSRFKMTFMQNGAKLVQALTPVIEKVADAFGRLADFIGGLSGEQLETILKIAGAVALISPVAGIISKITETVQGLMPVLTNVFNIIAMNPTIAIITAIGIALVALVTAIVKHWDEIKEVLGAIAGWVKEHIITPVTNFFTKLWDGLKNGAKTFANFFIGVVNKAIDGVNTIIRGINKIQVKMPAWLGGQSIGFNISQIKKIPMLAKGGVLTSGSAIVGEAGAELLTMQSGKAVVRPLTSGERASAGITINMNNTFNGYTSAQGATMTRELTRQINTALGRA